MFINASEVLTVFKALIRGTIAGFPIFPKAADIIFMKFMLKSKSLSAMKAFSAIWRAPMRGLIALGSRVSPNSIAAFRLTAPFGSANAVIKLITLSSFVSLTSGLSFLMLRSLPGITLGLIWFKTICAADRTSISSSSSNGIRNFAAFSSPICPSV